MPSAASAYTRVIKFGVPFWRDTAGTLHYYETSSPPTAATQIPLGTEADGLYSDWKERLASALTAYRHSQAARPRLVGKAAAAAAAKA